MKRESAAVHSSPLDWLPKITGVKSWWCRARFSISSLKVHTERCVKDGQFWWTGRNMPLSSFWRAKGLILALQEGLESGIGVKTRLVPADEEDG